MYYEKRADRWVWYSFKAHKTRDDEMYGQKPDQVVGIGEEMSCRENNAVQ